MMIHLATNLSVLRRKRKLSQQHMADLLGFSRSSYSTWERGGAEPDYDTLVRLAGFFHINVDRLLRQDLGRLGQYHLGQLLNGRDPLTYTPGKLDPTHETHP